MYLPRLLPALIGCISLFPLSSVSAHEFWIEPERHQVTAGETLQGYFKNGENFKGSTLSYFDRSSARYEMIAGGVTQKLSPRAGDSPALNVAAPVQDGLVMVIHETTPSRLTYKEWAKFQKFSAHKAFDEAEKDHIEAGWPQENFRERYTRHAKALFAVGSGVGQDGATGMKTEFVALTNPYAENFDHNMKVQVLFEGAARPDAQVEVFDRDPAGEVTITLHRTNNDGIATIPVTPGHSYLFDAVVLRPATDQGDQPERPILWETYWAALTFAVPQ